MTPIFNADPYGKIALQAYDPVAFHTDGKALKGNPAILAEYAGYKFSFASEENKALFEKQPETYLPAFGGYCAFGISIGVLFPVEIETWEIVDGRLLLQYNLDIKKLFKEHQAENLQKARENWATMEPELAG